ncbi:MAG: hypothetical protein JST87_18635 [Bacteroidetes bacterium]|nr:hypothetical protein [Bacteroidota bacterium]
MNIKILFIILFLATSCTEPHAFLMEIPHDYEGYLFVIYGVQAKGSSDLEQKGDFYYLKFDSMPIKLVRQELTENIATMRLGIMDENTHLKINREENYDMGKRMFRNKVSKITVHGKTYNYFSAFITRELYKEGSKELDSIMENKKFQLKIPEKILSAVVGVAHSHAR